jgi:MucR family transcriptional regulator, transcriptional regulator of exopolysaccharide biosynthesis
MFVNHDRGKGVIVNTEETNPHSTAMIVSSYVRHHTLRPEQLSDLITTVHHALSHLGQPIQTEEVLTPAVSVRRSVHHDYVVCLDCGYRGKMLRRHIGAQHALNSDEYLKRWGLRSDHPLTAPAYSERRSTMAKALGLGRTQKTAVLPAVTPTAAPTPVDVVKDTQATPARGRGPRAASKSADVASKTVAEAAPIRRRRSRSASKSPTADSRMRP